jgi:ABC-type antimicrobial peptide transport system permease subunit
VEFCPDEDALIACVLQHTLTVPDASLAEVSKTFGRGVRDLISRIHLLSHLHTSNWRKSVEDMRTMLVSIGQGAQSSIQSSIQSIGSNLIIVTPGAQRGPGVTVSAGRGTARSLKMSDVEAIQAQVTNIKAVAPEITSRYQVTAKGQNTNTSVVGTTPDYVTVRNVEVGTGTFITEQNIRSSSKVAVIGPTVRDDLFGADADPLGQSIRVNRVDFKIIGLTQAKGGSGFNNPDDMIFFHNHSTHMDFFTLKILRKTPLI